MQPVARYQSQLLFRKSYKPKPVSRSGLARREILVFRPVRAGPEIKKYEFEKH